MKKRKLLNQDSINNFLVFLLCVSYFGKLLYTGEVDPLINKTLRISISIVCVVSIALSLWRADDEVPSFIKTKIESIIWYVLDEALCWLIIAICFSILPGIDKFLSDKKEVDLVLHSCLLLVFLIRMTFQIYLILKNKRDEEA